MVLLVMGSLRRSWGRGLGFWNWGRCFGRGCFIFRWCRRSCGCRLGPGALAIGGNRAHHGIHLNGRAFGNFDVAEDPRSRCRNFGVHLVGRDFEQGFVALHFVTRLFQPSGDRPFENRFAHLGHDDISRHNSLPRASVSGRAQTYIIYIWPDILGSPGTPNRGARILPLWDRLGVARLRWLFSNSPAPPGAVFRCATGRR